MSSSTSPTAAPAPATIKRALGRGLADLIPVGGAGGSRDATPALGPGQEISISTVHANPRQPRTRFDDAALAELSESIRANGILQPILVRPRTAGGYEIVAGERRYRAALRAGLKSVPVVVRQLTDEETLALALIENLIREDIGPMETARAFHRLMEDFGWTQEEMGKRVGKSRTAITNSLRLLKLPDQIQQSVDKGELSEGHARTLIGDDEQRALPSFRERQLQIWQLILTKGLSVREVERLMKASRETGMVPETPLPAPGTTPSAADFKALEDRLRSALGTKVRLAGNGSRGRIEIEFFSGEELDGLLQRLEERVRAGMEETSARTVKTNPISGLLASRRPLD